MKGKMVVAVILVGFFTASGFGSFTQIAYQVTPLGSGRWQYSYDVTNLSLVSPIEEFTIWFNYTLPYANLTIETPDPPASGWDELVWQPDPLWSIDGSYDALALGSGIGTGQTVSGFAVSFDWPGTGVPGSQFYEIINPATWEAVDEGWTTSEPVTIIPVPGACILTVIGLGIIGFRKKHKAL